MKVNVRLFFLGLFLVLLPKLAIGTIVKISSSSSITTVSLIDSLAEGSDSSKCYLYTKVGTTWPVVDSTSVIPGGTRIAFTIRSLIPHTMYYYKYKARRASDGAWDSTYTMDSIKTDTAINKISSSVTVTTASLIDSVRGSSSDTLRAILYVSLNKTLWTKYDSTSANGGGRRIGFSLAGLAPKTNYYYKVYGQTSKNYIDSSFAVDSIRTDSLRVAVTQIMTTGSTANMWFQLSNSSVDTSKIFLYDSLGGKWWTIDSTAYLPGGSNFSFHISGLSKNTIYYYRLVALWKTNHYDSSWTKRNIKTKNTLAEVFSNDVDSVMNSFGTPTYWWDGDTSDATHFREKIQGKHALIGANGARGEDASKAIYNLFSKPYIACNGNNVAHTTTRLDSFGGKRQGAIAFMTDISNLSTTCAALSFGGHATPGNRILFSYEPSTAAYLKVYFGAFGQEKILSTDAAVLGLDSNNLFSVVFTWDFTLSNDTLKYGWFIGGRNILRDGRYAYTLTGTTPYAVDTTLDSLWIGSLNTSTYGMPSGSAIQNVMIWAGRRFTDLECMALSQILYNPNMITAIGQSKSLLYPNYSPYTAQLRKTTFWPRALPLRQYRLDTLNQYYKSQSSFYPYFGDSLCYGTGHKTFFIQGCEGGRGLNFGAYLSGYHDTIKTTQIYLESESDSIKSSFRIPAHWRYTGELMVINYLGNTTIPGIDSGTGNRHAWRYIIKVNDNFIRFARTQDSALAGLYVPILAKPSGSILLTRSEHWNNKKQVVKLDSCSVGDSAFHVGNYVLTQYSGDTSRIAEVFKDATTKRMTLTLEWLGRNGTVFPYVGEVMGEYSNRACTDTVGHGLPGGIRYTVVRDGLPYPNGYLFQNTYTNVSKLKKAAPRFTVADFEMDGYIGDSAKYYNGLRELQDSIDRVVGIPTKFMMLVDNWNEPATDSTAWDIRAATIAYCQNNPARADLVFNGMNMEVMNEIDVYTTKTTGISESQYCKSLATGFRGRVELRDTGTYIHLRLEVLSGIDTGLTGTDSFNLYNDSAFATPVGGFTITSATRLPIQHYTTAAQYLVRGRQQLRQYLSYLSGDRADYGFGKVYWQKWLSQDSCRLKVICKRKDSGSFMPFKNGFGNSKYHYLFEARTPSGTWVYAKNGVAVDSFIYLKFPQNVIGPIRYAYRKWQTLAEQNALTDTSQRMLTTSSLTGFSGNFRCVNMALRDTSNLPVLPGVYYDATSGTVSNNSQPVRFRKSSKYK